MNNSKLIVNLVAAAMLLACHTVLAFPILNLTPATPEISSSFITVDYVGNNSGGLLTASGFANVLTPPGAPSGGIVGGSFDINASLDFDAQIASGALIIGGTVLSLGFNSGTLLTGTFASTALTPTFGAGPGDVLEFLFNVTGGDAATTFGPTVGVILTDSGYPGSFASDFTSGAFQALASTFAPSLSVPEPTTLALMGLGIAGLGFRRKTQ